MNWDWLDYLVFAAMLLTVGAVYTLATRTSGITAYRIGVGVALAAAFLLVWVNAAVGIIGEEGNDANLMFFAVLAVGATGVLLARFRPGGMALALLITAIAQAGVAVMAIIGELGSSAPVWPRDVLLLTGFFTVLWLVSAWLFRSAAREQLAANTDPTDPAT